MVDTELACDTVDTGRWGLLTGSGRYGLFTSATPCSDETPDIKKLGKL